jgi:hypothetical protein
MKVEVTGSTSEGRVLTGIYASTKLEKYSTHAFVDTLCILSPSTVSVPALARSDSLVIKHRSGSCHCRKARPLDTMNKLGIFLCLLALLCTGTCN